MAVTQFDNACRSPIRYRSCDMAIPAASCVRLFINLQVVEQHRVLQTERDRLWVRLASRSEEAKHEVAETITRTLNHANCGTLEMEFEWLQEFRLPEDGKRRLVISEFGREAIGALPPGAFANV